MMTDFVPRHDWDVLLLHSRGETIRGVCHIGSLPTYISHRWNHIGTLYSSFCVSLIWNLLIWNIYDLIYNIDWDVIIFSFVILFIDSVYLLNKPQKAPIPTPSFPKKTSCFHVLQPCWKTEKAMTHEGSHESDPQSKTTKHSLTLSRESADLFFLAGRSLFLS